MGVGEAMEWGVSCIGAWGLFKSVWWHSGFFCEKGAGAWDPRALEARCVDDVTHSSFGCHHMHGGLWCSRPQTKAKCITSWILPFHWTPTSIPYVSMNGVTSPVLDKFCNQTNIYRFWKFKSRYRPIHHWNQSFRFFQFWSSLVLFSQFTVYTYDTT